MSLMAQQPGHRGSKHTSVKPFFPLANVMACSAATTRSRQKALSRVIFFSENSRSNVSISDGLHNLSKLVTYRKKHRGPVVQFLHTVAQRTRGQHKCTESEAERALLQDIKCVLVNLRHREAFCCSQLAECGRASMTVTTGHITNYIHRRH